ncbi:tyrosine-type recombinase/integrase [Georgenia muralis]
MTSLTKRPTGRWRARYRDPATGRETARHFRTRAEARRWLDETTTDHVTGRYVDPRAGTLTLADYYGRFAARQIWQPTTRRAMDHAVTASPLATLPLNRITPADVETWVKDMVDAGFAPTTVQARFSAVRTVLTGAVRDRLIVANPATGVRLPRTRERRAASRLPTPGQVDKLISLTAPPGDVAVALAAHAGLRSGEVRGLQVGDVDLTARSLTVRRQVRTVDGGGWEAVPPKYDSSRTVPINDELTVVLRRRLHRDGPPLPSTTWVVPGHRGAPIHPDTLGRLWADGKAAAHVDPALRLHDLRHYYASKLIHDGADIVSVQRSLGHARASTTLDVYAHLWRSTGAGTDR